MLDQFTLHGHRGCRGYLPENSLPAFHKAVDIGCHYLEMDVVITKDHQVLVSHEPWLNHEICTAPDGCVLTTENEKNYNLYDMTYQQIRQIDCGSKGHPRFVQQQAMRSYKPLLADLIDNIEAYTEAKGLLPVGYNIEIKRIAQDDGIFHPDAQVFSSLVIEVLKQKGVVQRAIFQTFDLECMEIGHRICPELTQSFLVDNDLTAEENFKLLSYQPPVFGPSYQQITNETMNYCTNNNIKVIPWTVNQPAAIQAMLQIGVAGMITDYPNRVLQALKTVEPS